MLYFAYGSNMNVAQMDRRCPGARPLGSAILPGYRLTYTFESRLWGGGVGTVVPDEADEVWGVLWDLEPGHVAALDRYEGVHKDIYRKEMMRVLHGQDHVEALVYVCTSEAYRRPATKYVRALVEGARAFGLPDAYVARLEAARKEA